MQAVKRILRYLKGTYNFVIRFISQISFDFYGFWDADLAGSPDTRRSTMGYCMFIGANCVSWSSKKQPTVARSNVEAEYRFMAVAVSEITWISSLLKDLGSISLHLPYYFVII